MKVSRIVLFRALAVLVLILIAAWMLVIGRGHTVYLDNKTLDYDGATYSAPYRVIVTVDGEQAAKLYVRERGQAICIGQTFRMSLAITEEKGGEETVQEVTIRLPYHMDGVIVNLPGYLAGLPEEAWLDEFVSAIPEPEPEPSDEDAIPGADDFLTDDGLLTDDSLDG